MAAEWRKRTVLDLQKASVLLVEDGNHGEYRPRKEEFVDSGVAFIRAADMDNGQVLFDRASRINDVARERITKGVGASGDVLLSHKGTVGKVALVREGAPPFVCSPQTTFWRTLDNSVLDRRFLHAFLRSPDFHQQLKSRSGETDMAPYVSLTAQRTLSIPLPPIRIQRAIAHILGTLDDKIELNRRMNETLEEMARALFKSWFVDFDPVHAKAEGREPSGMDAETAKLFPSDFEMTEHGRVPKGWTWRRLDELSDINAWSLSKKDHLEYIDYIDISSVSGGTVSEIVRYSRGTEPSRARRRLRHGDTVLSTVRPDRGSYFLCLHPKSSLIASTGFAVLSPTRAPWSFLHAACTQTDRFTLFGQKADGGAYPAIRPDVIGEILCAWPDNNDARAAFHRLTEPLYLRAAENRIQARTLATIRDTLLPRLLSGALSVRDANHVLESSA